MPASDNRSFRMKWTREDPMAASRRNFLIGTAGGALAAGGGGAQPTAVRVADPQHSFEMPRGMTLLNMRRDGGYRLGVKTNRGILDVVAAAQALNMPAPTDMDDLLQNGKGGVLKALVDAANSRAPESVFLREETVQYGPVVTRPEKIVMMGFNYRKHAEETNTPIPKNPVLFNKYNNALNHHGGTIKLPTEAAKHLYGVISVKALVRVVLSRCLFEGRPCPRLDPGNAEAIGSALGRLSQVVFGTESIPRGARQQAQPIALAYLYSVGHGGPEP